MKYRDGSQEGTLIYTDNDITTISKSQVFPKVIPYENVLIVLLTHSQYQTIPKRSLLNPEQETIDMGKGIFF